MKLQFEMDESAVSELESLRTRLGLTSIREVFDNAFALLAWAVKQKSNGRAIASLNPITQEYSELEMPALSHVARAALAKTGSD